jgi:hypothetical protein
VKTYAAGPVSQIGDPNLPRTDPNFPRRQERLWERSTGQSLGQSQLPAFLIPSPTARVRDTSCRLPSHPNFPRRLWDAAETVCTPVWECDPNFPALDPTFPALVSRGPFQLLASIPRHRARSSRSENLEVCLR